MLARVFLILVLAETALLAQAGVSGAKGDSEALVGRNYLHLDRLKDAQSHCDAALKENPANQIAKRCLNELAVMLADADLNNAAAELAMGHKERARALSAKWIDSHLERQQTRAWSILNQTRPTFAEWFVQQTPDWLRQLLMTMVVLTAAWLLLLITRYFWRVWQRADWPGQERVPGLWANNLGKEKTAAALRNQSRKASRFLLPRKTKSWTLYPLEEFPADNKTGLGTNLVLDALGRLGKELARPMWQPKLLLLRPTPPADYEPAIIDDFLSCSLPAMTLAPSHDDLCGEWQLHDIQLDTAIQNLQLKTSAGIDIGSVARLMRGIFEWFNQGRPTIHGIVENAKDQPVKVNLTGVGGYANLAAVTATTDPAPGIDALQLSAERAAFKFLLRLRYPELMTDEVDGFAALRQGVAMFSQYAGTVPCGADKPATRLSSLEKSAFNLSFFRSSIPVHSPVVCKATESKTAVNRDQSKRLIEEDMSSLKLTEGIRQAVLLAEGVTRALIASASGSSDKADDQYAAAIDSFRQLEDWPGSEDTEWLRQQARYNEAVVWRYKSAGVQRSVLMLTDLLGEKAPDTQDSKEAITHKSCSESPVSQPICLCARVARLSGLAKYTVDDWATFPNDRAQLIITDGDKVIPELERIWNDPKRPSHDQRIARYLHAAAVQAFGHIELMYTKTKLAKDRYGGDGRIIPGRLTEQGREVICSAIKWLEECDLSAAVCENYSDLAEAYLLRGDAGDYVRAQGYARHATLNPVQDERAFYLAAESALRQGTAESIAVAKQYAQAFHGTLTLDELKSIRRELELPEDNVVKASDAAKASAAASRS